MIPIKILCGCGQKYAFEVEPVGGRMSGAVLCPVCGLDGAAAANQIIASYQAAQGPPSRTRIGLQAAPTGAPAPQRPLAGAAYHAIPTPLNRLQWLWPACGGIAVLVLVWAGSVAWKAKARSPGPASPAVAAGEKSPGTLNELAASYVEPPAGRNAALFYSRGFEAMQIAKGGAANIPLLGKAVLPPLGSTMPASMKSTLAALIRSNDDALRLFAQGACFEQSRYPVDLSRGFETAYPHLPRIKGAVQLVELAGIFHGENREAEQAANAALAALALADSPAAEPSLFSQYFRASDLQMAVGALEQVVNRTSLPRESLGRLFQVLQKLEDREARGEGFNRGLAAESVKWIALLSSPQKLQELAPVLAMDLPEDQRARIVAAARQTGLLKAEQTYFEAAFQQVMETRTQPLPARLSVETVIRRKVSEAGPEKVLSARLLLPGLAASAAQEAVCLASIRLGLTAVALEQFRAARQNRYPSALSELTPDFLHEAPADPFDGRPLRYQTRGSGYLLYSVGPDRKDDSGKRMKGKEGDIVFAVVAPPKPL